jgi:hypothetical protein
MPGVTPGAFSGPPTETAAKKTDWFNLGTLKGVTAALMAGKQAPVDRTGINLKSAEAVAGGTESEATRAAVIAITKAFPGAVTNAMDDAYHRGNLGYQSKHPEGRAADMTIPGGLNAKTMLDIQALIGSTMKAEIHKNASGTGEHLHIEEKGPAAAAKAAAEQHSLLESTNNNSPVKVDVAELTGVMQEVLTAMRESNSTLDRIYSVTA